MSRSCQYLASIILVLIVVTGHCQENISVKPPRPFISRMNFNIGLAAIKPNSEQSFEDFLRTKFAVTGGLSLIHEFSREWEMSLQLNYARKGYKAVAYSTIPDSVRPAIEKFVDYISLNYIELVILPRATFGSRNSYNVGIGPYVGILGSQRLINERYINGTQVSTYGTRDDLPYLDYDVGLTFQVEYKRDMGRRLSGTVTFTFNQGILDIASNAGLMKNQSMCILVGITKHKMR